METRISRHSLRRLTAAAAAVGLVACTAGQTNAELVIDIRATAVNGVPIIGNNSDNAPEVVTVSAAGDVVSMDIVARVSGTNTLPDEYFKAMMGVFHTGTGGLLGDLEATNVAPFDSAAAAQPGTPIDYDSDGDLDVGSTRNSGIASHYFVASSGATAVADGTVVATDPSTEEFIIGQLTFTTGANPTGETFIDFQRRRNPTTTETTTPSYAAWNEDGDATEGIRTGIDPYALDGLTINVIPEPTGVALAAMAAFGLLARRRGKSMT